jgi:hypothetical protein
MWFNPIIRWLLMSPLHGFVSKNMMLISYTGRKSGKRFSTPVNYLRLRDAQGEYLFTTSSLDRSWWRNLRGGAPVTVRQQGQDYPAWAEAFEEGGKVTAELQAFFKAAPGMARYFDVSLDAAGQPKAEDVVRAAQSRVVIQFRLKK